MFVQALVSMRGFTTLAMPGLGGKSGLRRNYQLFARAYILSAHNGSQGCRGARYTTCGHRHDSVIVGRGKSRASGRPYTFVKATPWEKLI